eukprot:XP_011678706.1 PREDICTED: uncharacterized protein LOC105445194 [Strongylocentrotus purpuratus]
MAATTIGWMGLEQSLGNLTDSSVIAFHHRAIVASILIALTPIGLFGNALVIIAVVVAKKLRTITNILVINLAVTDFISCLCFPFMSAGLLRIHMAIVLMLMLMLYLLVLRHVLRHRKQIRDKFTTAEDIRSGATLNHESQASSTSRESRPLKINAISKMEVEITKNLSMVVGVLVLCILPLSIDFMIPSDNVFTLYAPMIMLTNSVVNPIIYGFKHPIFKEVFKSLLWPSRIA